MWPASPMKRMGWPVLLTKCPCCTLCVNGGTLMPNVLSRELSVWATWSGVPVDVGPDLDLDRHVEVVLVVGVQPDVRVCREGTRHPGWIEVDEVRRLRRARDSVPEHRAGEAA